MHSSSLRVQCIHGHMYQNGAKHGWALLLLSCYVLHCADMAVDQGRVSSCNAFIPTGAAQSISAPECSPICLW